MSSRPPSPLLSGKNTVVQKPAPTKNKSKKPIKHDNKDELILHIPIYEDEDDEEDEEDGSSDKNMFTMKSEEYEEDEKIKIKSLSSSSDEIDVKKLLLELKNKVDRKIGNF